MFPQLTIPDVITKRLMYHYGHKFDLMDGSNKRLLCHSAIHGKALAFCRLSKTSVKRVASANTRHRSVCMIKEHAPGV